MNIFVTSPDPWECARFLDNKRLVKMVMESSQLLATAINVSAGVPKGQTIAPIRSTHVNHPCAVWARQSVGNYRWLLKHFIALLDEYAERYGREHAYLEHVNQYFELIGHIPEGDQTPFVNCARNQTHGIDYTGEPDVHRAYKLYLVDRWTKTDKHPAKSHIRGA